MMQRNLLPDRHYGQGGIEEAQTKVSIPGYFPKGKILLFPVEEVELIREIRDSRNIIVRDQKSKLGIERGSHPDRVLSLKEKPKMLFLLQLNVLEYWKRDNDGSIISHEDAY
jgi:hypothetical protein